MSSSDIYTAKAIRTTVHVLGYWILAAAIAHAILLPIASAITMRVAAGMAAESMMQEMERLQLEQPALQPR